jgi:DNA mismatch repair protein MutL
VSHRDRLYQVYGERSDLMEVHKQAGGITLTGFIAALAEQGPTRGPQNVFINRRIVKDKTIAHAIIDSYSQASIKERSPEVHLFIEMPPDALDVNVHPTKAEVRFRDQSLVHEVVRRALRDALGNSAAPQLQLRPEHLAQTPFTATLPNVLSGGTYPNRWIPQDHDRKEPQSSQRPQSSFGTENQDLSAFSAVSAVPSSSSSLEIKPMIPLGQFRDTFIIAVDDEGIAIIDQHVAHERVLFERVMQKLTAGGLESQRLLLPMVMELSWAAQRALLGRAAELGRLGFELDEFGPTSIKVSAVPALLTAEDSSRALLALADDLEGLDRGAQVQEALQRIAATTACHAAVKANYPLTYEKMTHILDELRATAYSTVCPHGRPVMLRLTRREIEKNFDRI